MTLGLEAVGRIADRLGIPAWIGLIAALGAFARSGDARADEPRPPIIAVGLGGQLSQHDDLGTLGNFEFVLGVTMPESVPDFTFEAALSLDSGDALGGEVEATTMALAAEWWTFAGSRWFQLYGRLGLPGQFYSGPGAPAGSGFAPYLGGGVRLWLGGCTDPGTLRSAEDLFREMCIGLGIESRAQVPLSDTWMAGGPLMPGAGTLISSTGFTLKVGL